MKLKNVRNIFLGLSLLILFFGIGYRLGTQGVGRGVYFPSPDVRGKDASSSSSIPVDFSLFWDVWDRINRYYIDRKALDPQKMVYGAISGLVSSLEDPYTVFLPPDQNKETKDDLGGLFEGIGAQLGVKEKKIIIISPLKGSPAEKEGLVAGDWILKVDGKETATWTLPQAVAKIRGPKGTKVNLTILHKDASNSADISVTRDTIKVASVEWEVKNGKVVYLKLGRFGDSTTDEWTKAVADISALIAKSKGEIKGLVLDLRNNPGGYLSGSVFIASEFLEGGVVVIQESATKTKQTYEVNRKGKLLSLPMVVLINKGSASASEIVAGALKDRNRAKLVGETSFGKGSIQEAQELSGGAGIHITVAKWLLPSGRWINGSGIEPDIKVENDENNPDSDLQLEKAIESL